MFQRQKRHRRFGPDDVGDVAHAVGGAIGGLARHRQMLAENAGLMLGHPLFPLRHARLDQAQLHARDIGNVGFKDGGTIDPQRRKRHGGDGNGT
ncbi:MAG: hypothetical protein IPL91_16310, partial [Hyphomicrobium sp.]|nr:hypothetical protein [Hyphomicrobium sp.]